MKVRELLQIELWSKRTSRRILVGFGIVFGLVAVGLGVLFAIERYWLTRGERNAAKVALVQIEALQSCVSCGDQEFDARDKQVEQSVEIASQAGLTDRDEGVSRSLLVYLDMIESEHQEPQITRMIQERDERYPQSPDSCPALEESMRLYEKQMTRLLHSELHKALD
jgi:hypothetical protein